MAHNSRSHCDWSNHVSLNVLVKSQKSTHITIYNLIAGTLDALLDSKNAFLQSGNSTASPEKSISWTQLSSCTKPAFKELHRSLWALPKESRDHDTLYPHSASFIIKLSLRSARTAFFSSRKSNSNNFEPKFGKTPDVTLATASSWSPLSRTEPFARSAPPTTTKHIEPDQTATTAL